MAAPIVTHLENGKVELRTWKIWIDIEAPLSVTDDLIVAKCYEAWVSPQNAVIDPNCALDEIRIWSI